MNEIIRKDQEKNEIEIKALNSNVAILLDLDIWEKYCKPYDWYTYEDSIIRVRATIDRRRIEMHRYIYECVYPETVYYNLDIDHKSKNRMDNRLNNLRCLSHQSNTYNKTREPSRRESSKRWELKTSFGGSITAKTFYDNTYGSKEKSYQACLDYINGPYTKKIDQIIEENEKKRLMIEFERGVKGLRNIMDDEAIISLFDLFMKQDDIRQYWGYSDPQKHIEFTAIDQIKSRMHIWFSKNRNRYFGYLKGLGDNRKLFTSTKSPEAVEVKIYNYYLQKLYPINMSRIA